MKHWIKKFLLKRGWTLNRVPARQLNISIPSRDIKEVNNVIHQFSRTTKHKDLQDPKKIKGYLTVERRQLFHDLVRISESEGISFEDKHVGDVGCGMGYLFRVLDGKNANQLTGYDTYSEILDLAQEIAPKAEFKSGSLYEVNGSFDVLFCMEVLEHMTFPEKAIRHLINQLGEGGRLILSVPNGRIDQQAAGALRDDGESYWGHVHFWSPESWKLLVQKFEGDISFITTGEFGIKHLFAIMKK